MWANRAKIGQAPSRRQASPASHFCRTWLRALGAGAENSPQSPEGSANSLARHRAPFFPFRSVLSGGDKREKEGEERERAAQRAGSERPLRPPRAPSHRVPEARPCPGPYAEHRGHRRAFRGRKHPLPPTEPGPGTASLRFQGRPRSPRYLVLRALASPPARRARGAQAK